MLLNDRNLAILWLYLVIVHFCFWFSVLHRFYMINASLSGLILYIFRNEIPIITLASLFLEPPELKIRKAFYIIWFLSLSFITYGLLINLPFKELTGFNWSYQAIFSYLFFLVVYFELLRKKTTQFKALGISLFLCLMAGVIYEIPLIPLSLFFGIYHVSFLTVVNPKFLTVPFFSYLVLKSKWKWKSLRSRNFFIAYFIFWLLIEILYPIFQRYRHFSLLIRIPTLILFAILIECLNRES